MSFAPVVGNRQFHVWPSCDGLGGTTQNLRTDRDSHLCGDHRAFGFEQEENVVRTVIERLVIALSLGQNQVRLVNLPAKLRRAFAENRARRIGAVVNHCEIIGQSHRLRVGAPVLNDATRTTMVTRAGQSCSSKRRSKTISPALSARYRI